METQEQTQTEEQPKLQELVLYDIVSMDFVWDNTYAMGGLRPNAKHIAGQYGCKLEIREAEYRDRPGHCLVARRRYSIGDDGSTQSAVLVGEDRDALARARDDIWRTHGVAPFDHGSVSVGGRKFPY